MIPKNLVNTRVRLKFFRRNISFFGNKQPEDGNKKKRGSLFDMASCISDKPLGVSTVKSVSPLEGLCTMPSAIVIGAGMSGLTAAYQLFQAGVKDVLVIEAADRPGGRIMSAWVGDAIIEFGPSVLQGASLANPVYNLANVSKAMNHPIKRVRTPNQMFLTDNGTLIEDSRVERLIFQQILKDLKSKKSLKPSSPSSSELKSSLMQYLGLRVQQEMLHIPEARKYKSERVLWGIINSMRLNFGADLSNVSVDALQDKMVTPGGSIVLDGGMNRLFSHIFNVIPDKNILYNTPVQSVRVDPSEDPQVKVVTSSGKTYEADFVVVTLPLGVLKAKHEEIFGPSLTETQRLAIKNIEVGMKNHIYLEYAQPWWVPQMGQIYFGWGMQHLENSTEWNKGIGCINEVPNSKHLLVVEMAGEEASLIEGVTDEEIAIQVTKVLRKYTGDNSIPFPSNIITTRWTSNPYARGATVYAGHNTTTGTFKDLANSTSTSPIIFAGDATIPHYYGSVEGARRSGLRAAETVVKLAKLKWEKEMNKDFESPSEDHRGKEKEKIAVEKIQKAQ